ncbi:MAG: single-stranded DNA-binding protein [Oscillospiraceae bacterium]|jgi:hypothetical protein|nr:single-stranded DNA-binding protein [Oscillospiraceae bacterium]
MKKYTIKRYKLVGMGGINQLLQQALAELENLGVGDCFLLEDLFLGYVWKKLQPTNRKVFGRYFSFYIKGKGQKYITVHGKNTQNQKNYRKIK